MMATCRGREALASGLRWAEGVLTIGAEGYKVMSRGQNQKERDRKDEFHTSVLLENPLDQPDPAPPKRPGAPDRCLEPVKKPVWGFWRLTLKLLYDAYAPLLDRSIRAF